VNLSTHTVTMRQQDDAVGSNSPTGTGYGGRRLSIARWPPQLRPLEQGWEVESMAKKVRVKKTRKGKKPDTNKK
jgi:hypothetical protein